MALGRSTILGWSVEGLGAFVIDHEPSSTGNFSIQFISLELWANCEPSLTIPLPGMHPQP